MALQHAILAALSDGESSGYDLAKMFDVTVANFWSATPQQLYRELDKMEHAGLVHGRVVAQEKRPNKRVFALTDDGRTELHAYTTRAPKPIAIRDELLVQVEALDQADVSAVIGHVQEKLTQAEAKLARYERRRARMLGEDSEDELAADPSRLGPYLTLARGIAFERENVAWCDLALRTLTPHVGGQAGD